MDRLNDTIQYVMSPCKELKMGDMLLIIQMEAYGLYEQKCFNTTTEKARHQIDDRDGDDDEGEDGSQKKKFAGLWKWSRSGEIALKISLTSEQNVLLGEQEARNSILKEIIQVEEDDQDSKEEEGGKGDPKWTITLCSTHMERWGGGGQSSPATLRDFLSSKV